MLRCGGGFFLSVASLVFSFGPCMRVLTTLCLGWLCFSTQCADLKLGSVMDFFHRERRELVEESSGEERRGDAPRSMEEKDLRRDWGFMNATRAYLIVFGVLTCPSLSEKFEVGGSGGKASVHICGLSCLRRVLAGTGWKEWYDIDLLLFNLIETK